MELVILMLEITLVAIGGLAIFTYSIEALSKVQMSSRKKQNIMKAKKLMACIAFILTTILALLKSMLEVGDRETAIIIVFIGVYLIELIRKE